MRVKSIAIVGGGSSGWMAAAYLNRVLFDVQLTLIESATVSKIGVGEATVPFLNDFMAKLGLADYRLWLPACDGTLKTGILFENWLRKGDRYWHPFENLDYLARSCHTGHCWLNWHRQQQHCPGEFSGRDSFFRAFFLSTELNAAEHRAPVVRDFAYHLNADRFGELLKSITPGIHHIEDDVVKLAFDENGGIASLITAHHGSVAADLFIDCTGFQRRLIKGFSPAALFESFASSLFCDRAVVFRLPYRDEASPAAEMRPYVTASAQQAGWTWQIPLYSNISSGYVYSSSFLSESQAEEELASIWGAPRSHAAQLYSVKFETGKLKTPWIKNCIAVGLAGGFIEPLESTGLAITQVGIEILASMLDARYFDERTASRYNGHMDKLYEDISDFIVAHYCLTARQDTPFWRAVKHDTVIPDRLSARLATFRSHLPSHSTKGTAETWMFRDVSWLAVLVGMNFPFETPRINPSILQNAAAIARLKAQRRQELRLITPGHFEYLRDSLYRETPVG